MFKKDKVKEGDKLLGIIKENGGGDKGASAAGVTLIAGPDKAVLEGDPPPPGEPFNFPNLSRMKRSLDNVWSNSLLKQGGDVRSLLFCGPAPNQGSSHVAVHLAMFLATEFNIKTLFVDAVLNKGKSRRYFSNAGAFPGLAAYFSKGTPLDGLVLESTVPSLYVLPSGGENAPLSAGAVIAKRHTQQALVDYCHENFDVTIFGCNPVVSAPWVVGLARLADQVILVCRYASARREVCQLSIEKFQDNGVEVGGVVLNDRKFPVPMKIYNLLK